MKDLSWLHVTRGNAPLVISLPHTGTDLADVEPRLVSPWLARKDTDWWIDKLYDFALDLGATVIHTAISRTVVDVNRDPSGISLYPGQATTDLCPFTTFDGEALYRLGQAPSADEIAERRRAFFDPYHRALAEEISRLRHDHETVVIYDCHSIRSRIPRLFDGELPNFNIGTNNGRSCADGLCRAVQKICEKTSFSCVADGRFKGGWITRCHGDPASGVHAIQMELTCRSYMHEPLGVLSEANWPSAFDDAVAAPMRGTLIRILKSCSTFAMAAQPEDHHELPR